MLRAFFDDSGTHEGSPWGASKVLAFAGIFGTEAEMRGLEVPWRHHLAHPLSGAKQPLTRFHMTACQDSRGEFTGWTRTETDFFCHQLGTVIIESGVSAYGMACVRKDWDDLITGDVRAILGDAEGNAVRNCFLKATAWAQTYTFDPKMMFFIDDAPSDGRQQRDCRERRPGQAALRAGAQAAVDGNAPDAARQIIDATNGGAGAVIDLVGSSRTVQLALDSIGKGGKLIVVGLFGGDITVPTPFFPLRAMTIQGSYLGSLSEMAELLDIVRRKGAPDLPVGTRPLAGVNEALNQLKAGKVVGRLVLTPG